MPVTKDQAQMLAALAVACRPTGAPRWDEPGVMAALAKVSHISLADVMAATARAASDRSAETPGVIAATSSLHWVEKVAERTTPLAPKREEQCLDCGRHLNHCLCGGQVRQRTRGDASTGANAARAAAGYATKTQEDADA